MEYEQKAITTTIRATSRASVKIRDNFYTLEYCEERVIPDIEGVDLEMEKRLLWDDVNREVDQQIEDTYNALKNNR
mgnify:CR=1 FL=1